MSPTLDMKMDDEGEDQSQRSKEKGRERAVKVEKRMLEMMWVLGS